MSSIKGFSSQYELPDIPEGPSVCYLENEKVKFYKSVTQKIFAGALAKCLTTAERLVHSAQKSTRHNKLGSESLSVGSIRIITNKSEKISK